MQRRIKQTYRHRTFADDLIHLIEIFFQHWTNFIQRFLTSFLIFGKNHLTHHIDAVAFKEHMLGTAETDALGAEFNRLFGITRRIGIGTNLKTFDLIDPAHEFTEITGERRRFSRQFAFINCTCGAVQRQRILRRKDFTVDGKRLGLIVDAQIMSTGDTAFAHAASNDGRMGGHAAASGDNALCGDHATQIFRRGFVADKKNGFAILCTLFRIIRTKGDFSRSSARRSRKTLGQQGRAFQ